MASKKSKITRRGALQLGAGLTLGATLPLPAMAETPMGSSVYESLGVKHVINAAGTFTNLGGSLMPPEVVAAWVDASKHFVNIQELQDKVGEKIAKLAGVEAALVTTGAAGAILLGTAAVVTRGDPEQIAKLPHLLGTRNEVLIQKSHRSGYDSQMTNVGVKLIEVVTAADLKKVIGERTALMFFMNHATDVGKIGREEWIALARQAKVPTLLDAAADVPPVSRLSEYNQRGFDLVAFSGGKAMRGPNDTGLLFGSKELIAAAKRNTNPQSPTIGRMMKVSKEDMIALLAAVERFVKLDHAAELREWERRIAVIEKSVMRIPTVACERVTPAIANRVPHLQISWDESKRKITPAEVTRQLAAGNPTIQIGRVHGSGSKGILVSVFVLADGEEKIVAERIHDILTKA